MRIDLEASASHVGDNPRNAGQHRILPPGRLTMAIRRQQHPKANLRLTFLNKILHKNNGHVLVNKETSINKTKRVSCASRIRKIKLSSNDFKKSSSF